MELKIPNLPIYWIVYVVETTGLGVYPVAKAPTFSVSEALTVIGPVYFVDIAGFAAGAAPFVVYHNCAPVEAVVIVTVCGPL